MNEKLKIAMYWCSSCGGCEESIIDLAEDLENLAERADIVFWPIAMDFKTSHVTALAKGEIDVSLINGAIRMEAHAEMAKLLRATRRKRTAARKFLLETGFNYATNHLPRQICTHSP